MSRISEATSRLNEECIIIGTIYKDMPLISRILKEFTAEVNKRYRYICISFENDLKRFVTKRALIPQPPRQSYVSAEDILLLEDESGRILLCGDAISKDSLVTGVVLALKGKALFSGDFQVDDLCFPEFPSQTPLRGKHELEWLILMCYICG